MKNSLSNKLLARLEHLSQEQIEQLVARAKSMRRRSNDKNESLSTWVERVLDKDKRTAKRADRHLQGLVVSITSQTAVAETEEGHKSVRVLGHQIAVGDWVTLAVASESEASVIEVSARRTKLSRPDVGLDGREQVIASNVDLVVIVVSVGSPPLHPRLIDRYLVAIQQGRAEPLIFVNKLDLLEDESELDVLDSYRGLGVPVVLGSITTGRGADELRGRLEGKTCAFVGHSGVGKSSIVNALKPEAEQKTGEVSEGYGRGTHTTTSTSMHLLSDGTRLIDTPGIRSFGLRELDSSQIGAYFTEFDGVRCRFRDCSHVHEPDCGVKAAVESGEIAQARYDAYCRLRDELES